MLKRFRELRQMVARAIGPDRQCRVGRHCRKRILPSHYLSLLIEKKNLARGICPLACGGTKPAFYPMCEVKPAKGKRVTPGTYKRGDFVT